MPAGDKHRLSAAAVVHGGLELCLPCLCRAAGSGSSSRCLCAAPATAPLGLSRIPPCSRCHHAVSSPAWGVPEIWSLPYPPPECKLGHPLHPIRSKLNSAWGKEAKYRAKNSLPKSIYSGADMTFLYPSQLLYGKTSYLLRNPCDKSQHTYHESTAPLSCRANLLPFCLLSYRLQNNEVAGSERVNLRT